MRSMCLLKKCVKSVVRKMKLQILPVKHAATQNKKCKNSSIVTQTGKNTLNIIQLWAQVKKEIYLQCSPLFLDIETSENEAPEISTPLK